MEAVFMNNRTAILAIPSQGIKAASRPLLLQNYPDCLGEPYRIMRGVGRKEKHLALANWYIFKFPFVNDFQQHGSRVLIKPFGCLINVIIRPRIWAPNDLVYLLVLAFQDYYDSVDCTITVTLSLYTQ